MFVGQTMVVSMNLFFGNTIVAFSLENMILRIHKVEIDLKFIVKLIDEGTKGIVCMDASNA